MNRAPYPSIDSETGVDFTKSFQELYSNYSPQHGAFIYCGDPESSSYIKSLENAKKYRSHLDPLITTDHHYTPRQEELELFAWLSTSFNFITSYVIQKMILSNHLSAFVVCGGMYFAIYYVFISINKLILLK